MTDDDGICPACGHDDPHSENTWSGTYHCQDCGGAELFCAECDDHDGVPCSNKDRTIARLRAAANGWRPIATAPTGAELLLWEDWGACAVGYRHGESCGWVTEDGRGLTPTHWQPLPAPPGAER